MSVLLERDIDVLARSLLVERAKADTAETRYDLAFDALSKYESTSVFAGIGPWTELTESGRAQSAKNAATHVVELLAAIAALGHDPSDVIYALRTKTEPVTEAPEVGSKWAIYNAARSEIRGVTIRGLIDEDNFAVVEVNSRRYVGGPPVPQNWIDIVRTEDLRLPEETKTLAESFADVGDLYPERRFEAGSVVVCSEPAGPTYLLRVAIPGAGAGRFFGTALAVKVMLDGPGAIWVEVPPETRNMQENRADYANEADTEEWGTHDE